MGCTMTKPVLIIMAAGVGSRFGGGGLKQVAPVDNAGHIMMDYTIFDAARAYGHIRRACGGSAVCLRGNAGLPRPCAAA